MARIAERKRPDGRLERQAARAGGLLAGIDEAGVGPWAGPVVAAAVILDPERIPEGLDDSKRLDARRRDALQEAIRATARIGIGIAEVGRIDRDNVLAANLWAMAEAVRQLGLVPGEALVDGRNRPTLPCPVRAIVGGDGLVASIAAASIVAKVTRDAIMAELAAAHPGYGWERNRGYGTSEHQAAIARLGLTPHHRRSFAPIRRHLEARGPEGHAVEGVQGLRAERGGR